MMRRYSLTPIRLLLAIAATVIASLAVATTAAQAIVVNDSGTDYGVALVPGTGPALSVPAVTTSGSCPDPSLAPDLHWLTYGRVSPLCYHGGSVIHTNKTYVLTWDPERRYWATTRNFIEQFLSDVATVSNSSNPFGSPYALTPQYFDDSGRAQNKSIYAGGCIDYGSAPANNGGYTCRFGANHPSGTGWDYPMSGNCPWSGLGGGTNVWYGQPNGPLGEHDNEVCLTDAQIKDELVRMLPQMVLPVGSATPLVDVLLPPGVAVCLDQAGHACSANIHSVSTDPTPAEEFCSYHSTVNLPGSLSPIAYVVQPWTAQWGQGVGCDDPSAPNIQTPIDVTTLANSVGAKLVSPLSQGELAAIVNPAAQGWFGVDGSEINDNGCGPLDKPLDMVTIAGNSYALQREFNNAGAIETDPNALPCSGVVNLNPTFVVPTGLEAGDNFLFDGSVTDSTLMIHNGAYLWNFGDGTTGIGPSVYHGYANAGNYHVTLTVTDRGGNTATVTQTVQVLGANGQPVPSPGPGSGSGSGGSGSKAGLKVHLQLLPQSLKAVLQSGIKLRVTSNKAANGIATLWITRISAKKAHIKTGKGAAVRIGIGTVSSITNGTVTLRLHLSPAMAKKLAHLHHVAMTVRLALVGSGSQRLSIVAAGRY